LSASVAPDELATTAELLSSYRWIGSHIASLAHPTPAIAVMRPQHSANHRFLAQARVRSHQLADRVRSVTFLRAVLGRWRSLTSHCEDVFRGIRTERLITPKGNPSGADAHLYVPLAYGQTRRVLRALQLHPDDVVVDLGCGLGRVVALAAQRDVSRVIGIEFDVEIAELARQNMQTLRRRRSPAEVTVADAADASLDGVTVLILFNPFGPRTMQSVLAHLATSIENEPRTVRIAYVNPTAEAEFERVHWLTRTSSSRSARFRHTVSFWNAEPAFAVGSSDDEHR
jgi:predicted RNA methylase